MSLSLEPATPPQIRDQLDIGDQYIGHLGAYGELKIISFIDEVC